MSSRQYSTRAQSTKAYSNHAHVGTVASARERLLPLVRGGEGRDKLIGGPSEDEYRRANGSELVEWQWLAIDERADLEQVIVRVPSTICPSDQLEGDMRWAR